VQVGERRSPGRCHQGWNGTAAHRFVTIQCEEEPAADGPVQPTAAFRSIADRANNRSAYLCLGATSHGRDLAAAEDKPRVLTALKGWNIRRERRWQRQQPAGQLARDRVVVVATLVAAGDLFGVR